MTNILLVEDHHLVRNGIKMLLESQSNLSVVAEANNGEDALTILGSGTKIDLVITDITMDGVDGLALTEHIQTLHPTINVIILSMINDHRKVSICFEKGAKAYLIKSVDYNELLFAVSHVIRGGKYMCESVMMGMVSQVHNTIPKLEQAEQILRSLDLSQREIEVLHLIGDGFTNNEIADKLFLSKRTVEGHRQNLIDKTHVRNSAQLVKYAVKHGLI